MNNMLPPDIKETTAPIESSSRIGYIDVAKAILIIMVMVGHVQNVCEQLSIKDRLCQNIDYFENFWGPFFMPAFFFITGYCSSFAKRSRVFIISNLKSLIIPAILLGIIAKWITLIGNLDLDFKQYVNIELKRILLYGGAFWFLPSLFLAKIIYYYLYNNFCQNKVFICILLYFIGFVLYYYQIGDNYWYYKHSLMLTYFIALGNVLKEIKISPSCLVIISLWGGYLLALCILLMVGQESPHIAHKVNLSWQLIIPNFILSSLGSVLIIFSSKYIHKSTILIWIGRHSLIFYCLHISFFFIYFKLLYFLFQKNIIFSLTGWVLGFIISLGSCSVFVWILSKKYFKFVLGKF